MDSAPNSTPPAGRTGKTYRERKTTPCSYCGRLFAGNFNVEQHIRETHTGRDRSNARSKEVAAEWEASRVNQAGPPDGSDDVTEDLGTDTEDGECRSPSPVAVDMAMVPSFQGLDEGTRFICIVGCEGVYGSLQQLFEHMHIAHALPVSVACVCNYCRPADESLNFPDEHSHLLQENLVLGELSAEEAAYFDFGGTDVHEPSNRSSTQTTGNALVEVRSMDIADMRNNVCYSAFENGESAEGAAQLGLEHNRPSTSGQDLVVSDAFPELARSAGMAPSEDSGYFSDSMTVDQHERLFAADNQQPGIAQVFSTPEQIPQAMLFRGLTPVEAPATPTEVELHSVQMTHGEGLSLASEDQDADKTTVSTTGMTYSLTGMEERTDTEMAETGMTMDLQLFQQMNEWWDEYLATQDPNAHQNFEQPKWVSDNA
ncbi:hypothetical protein H2203_008716 [Taxawa tesnikishii (nom. ined.)]|nr:hypothetical protein H2203_008716 [Dothideales sp. JES 119]